MYYTGNARGFVGWPVKQVMEHYLAGPNIGLLVPKATRDAKFAHAFVTDKPTEAIFLSGTTGSNAMNLPLYVYTVAEEDSQGQRGLEMGGSKRPNFDPKTYAAIRERAGLDKEPLRALHDKRDGGKPDELRVFDYIYGVLHSPHYRERYAQPLKTGFPIIPYPPTPKAFADVAEKGEQLRRLHLMEPAAIGDTAFAYEGGGDDIVASGYPKFESGKVHINKNQYFADVPKLAWEFYIGGYQPAQKWLKDRRGRSLSFDDITHYQRIVKILVETDRIMKEIELPLE